ncbi:hypothetical protein AXF42_Ash020666 [Apostasia shenzhenica]|uniref:Uncharacterized protein n=1 Tax=Apostasia shenzhenica TaxID=1088818 RepID=A0A2H9ZW50_9ASPA|nr:hypothetical protein AXF42_Ash020666 [Apostasia shenzhenica]
MQTELRVCTQNSQNREDALQNCEAACETPRPLGELPGCSRNCDAVRRTTSLRAKLRLRLNCEAALELLHTTLRVELSGSSRNCDVAVAYRGTALLPAKLRGCGQNYVAARDVRLRADAARLRVELGDYARNYDVAREVAHGAQAIA